ncbi:type 4b pilus protein PilO2, partial [Sphingomonas sp. 10B4]
GYMREARQFGRKEMMDIVAIRPAKTIIQAGFVAHNDGAVKGMYSLAASLAGQLGDSWIAAWRVSPNEDRYALVAVDQGAVLPACDQVGT